MPLEDDEYEALFAILSGEKGIQDWPKNDKKALRQRVYRKLKSVQYQVREVHDPITAQTSKRIVHTATGNIVVKKSELQSSAK